MGNTNSTSSRTNIETNILQAANNNCQVTAAANVTNDTFIAHGDIDASQIVDTSFSCAISNTFDATITNVIQDAIKQTATTENGILLPSFGADSNTVNINENIGNVISQMMNNNCVVINEANSTGSFYYSQTGSITANQSVINGTQNSCNMTNMATASAANTVQNTVTQTASITNALTTIIIVLAICGTVGAVGVKAFSKAPVAKSGGAAK